MPRFRLLKGKHSEKHPILDKDGNLQKDHLGRVLAEVKVYRQGDVFDSRHDLATIFNQEPHSIKFERVTNDVGTRSRRPPTEAQAPSPEPRTSPQNPQVGPLPAAATKPLEQMTVKELQELAEAEEIDLKGQVRKDDIIKTLRSSNVS